MNTKVIYTAIFNNYDTIKLNTFINHDYDYILFTDNETLEDEMQGKRAKQSNWKVIILSGISNYREEARKLKTQMHGYLSKYKESIWIDGCFQQIGDLNEFTEPIDRNFATVKHSSRSSVYDEADACVKNRLDDKSTIQAQMMRYKEDGYLDDLGLVASGIIYRKRGVKNRKINAAWWKEIEKGSIRDQLSLNYVLWKLKHTAQTLERGYIDRFFKQHKHISK